MYLVDGDEAAPATDCPVCYNNSECINGECVCKVGFSGDLCEIQEEGESHWMLWTLLFTLMVAAALYLFVGAERLKQKA